MSRDQARAFPSVPAGRRRAAALAWMAIAVAFLALAPQARAEDRAGVVAVTGSGSIERAPDYAQIHVTVTTAAPQVPEAVDANNARTQEVLARLEAIGVAREDITTASFQVYATPENRRLDDAPRPEPGFTAEHRLRIESRDIDGIGALTGDILALGALTFQSISFHLDSSQEAEEEALRRAVADARRQAEILADATGARLGAVRMIGDPGVSGRGFQAQPMSAMRMEGASAVPIVPPTSLRFEAQVRIEWELGPGS
ncbi:MAG: SIMPL domain-containing protein [Salinarimonas sp.]